MILNRFNINIHNVTNTNHSSRHFSKPLLIKHKLLAFQVKLKNEKSVFTKKETRIKTGLGNNISRIIRNKICVNERRRLTVDLMTRVFTQGSEQQDKPF